MLLEPDGVSDVIVGIMVEGKYSWYVTEKELWFMDYKKFREDFKRKYEQLNIPYNTGSDEILGERAGFEILNEFSIREFKKVIEKYQASVEELRSLLELYLLVYGSEDAYFRFLPALHLDFDKKELYSLYTEHATFEAYVPEGWIGKYASFLAKIEMKEKYWRSENGEPLIYFGEEA